jgi:hypothetical protein
MQVPILNGIYTDNSPEYRVSYPVNMVPVAKAMGISSGYLRPGDGLVQNGTGPGTDRGGINWNGVCYRVMGTKLVSVANDGTVTILGDVGGTSLVTFDYSFDRLAIASNNNLFYWDGTTLTQVTDPDLGIVLDVVWVDGYFMTTDGEFLVVTDLTDPTQVNPFRYGSSEVDPDPINAILKLRNEIYALNRHTIEVFDNVGGDFFPFDRVDGGQIQKGCVGTHACCVFVDAIAFLGSGKNEAPGIYLGVNANTTKISTIDIDLLLREYTEAQLANVKVESVNDRAHQHLYVHLPDRTIVYDAASSLALQTPVWFTLTSTLNEFEQYRARDFVWCYDKWLVGDPQSNAVGYTVQNISSHWGSPVRWEFGTTIAYNDSKGAIFHELELVALTGRVALGPQPTISTSYSYDGIDWTNDYTITAGAAGNRLKRLVWFRNGFMDTQRMQRFRGTSNAHISFARLEAQVEPLAV